VDTLQKPKSSEKPCALGTLHTEDPVAKSGFTMHVVMLAGEYPPRWGGMATTIFHLTAELAASGHKVTVITRRGTGDAPPIPGVRIIGVRWLKAPMAFTRSFGRHALRALLRLHAEDPVDVVHVHTPLIAWNRRQFQRCHREVAPTVTTLHGSWIGEREGLLMARRRREPAAIANPNDLAILLTAKAYARYEQAALDESTCVAISSFSRQEFVDRYRPPAAWECEVIHWGIDTEMFHPRPERASEAKALRTTLGVPEGHHLLLAVGRLAARKGYATLIDGFAALRERREDVHLAIVGRGHLKARLLRHAAKRGVAEAVHIESSLPFEALADAYRAADLVVFPSLYEGLGMIPIESMASGTPVITVDHGPMPETVDSTTGALYPVGDHDAFARVVDEELTDATGLETKGAAGRQKVLDRFTMAREVEAYLGAYARACGNESE
jgi:glycosyltransferase involved in cell wall biosynthesis